MNMRLKLVVFFMLITLGGYSREVHDLNRNWKFFAKSEVTSDASEIVNLPHMWNNDALGGKRDYYRGIGNYLRDIQIPKSWSGKRIFIRCYGANVISNVLVNGSHVGEHRGGYTTFTYDITDYIKFGATNYLWFIVNNAPQLDVLPTAGDQNVYGGLFRDVELIVTNPTVISLTDYGADGVYVDQKKVTEEVAEGETRVQVDGAAGTDVTAEVTLLDGNGEEVYKKRMSKKLTEGKSTTFEIPYSIKNPILWNGTINPHLYRVNVKLFEKDVAVDSLTVETGFRYYGINSSGRFTLNGAEYPIKGVIVNQDRAMVGNAITSYQLVEDLELINEMGANAVRVAYVQHHQDFYSLCDRMGLVVLSDLPLVGGTYLTDKAFINTPSYRVNCEIQVDEIVNQQYNHPSVLFWGVFSNMSVRGDNPTSFIKMINERVKNIDPSRMTVATSNEDGNLNFITDLIIWDQYLGWIEGYPEDVKIWRQQLEDQWPDLHSGISYAAGASIYHQDDSLYRPIANGNWHPERWQTHFHESYFKILKNSSMWGTFVGNMFDYGAVGRKWGEGNGINDCGLVTFDRRYRKDAFYLYKANWNTTDPFVYISERRWNIRKDKTQTIRVYSNCREVELVVNGVVIGAKNGVDGIFEWEKIAMKSGINKIEAISGGNTDYIHIDVRSNNSNVVGQ